MRNNVVDVDRYAHYTREIRNLKDRNAELENLNHDLVRRLDELYGVYQELRYAMKGMTSQAEVLVLRKRILELQNRLQLTGSFPRKH